MVELAVLPSDIGVRQWVVHTGIAPLQIQSGKAVDRPARISRRHNGHFRRSLFLPAFAAAQQEPHVSAFCQKLPARGKTEMRAHVGVLRKLLHLLHGMLKHDREFEGEQFYALGA